MVEDLSQCVSGNSFIWQPFLWACRVTPHTVNKRILSTDTRTGYATSCMNIMQDEIIICNSQAESKLQNVPRSFPIFLCKAQAIRNPPLAELLHAVLPKIDAMQQTLNPLERIVTPSKFNRWSCKRYHFSWIQSLPCHLCWLSQRCYKSSREVQETGGFCVQSIRVHGRVLSQEVDQRNGIPLDLGVTDIVLFLPLYTVSLQGLSFWPKGNRKEMQPPRSEAFIY